MYVPAVVDPLRVPAIFWQSVFATSGILGLLWAVGGVGRVPTLIWLLTSIDLIAMVYMWSSRPATLLLGWSLTGYFMVQSGLWAIDAYRRLDGRTPIIGWSLTADASGTAVVTTPHARTVASDTLIGQLDVGVSMIAMTLGMAYMLAAMSLS